MQTLISLIIFLSLSCVSIASNQGLDEQLTSNKTIVISTPIKWDSSLEIKDRELIFTDTGSLEISEGSVLSLENCSISITKTDLNRSHIFDFSGSKLYINGCNIIYNNSCECEQSDAHPPITLIAALGPSVRQYFNVRDNTFTCLKRHSLALLNGNNLYGVIENNTVMNFHGVFRALNSTGLSILNNSLIDNSFYNIHVSGSALKIMENFIKNAGLNGTGDGMTFFDIKDSVISSNIIKSSFCYSLQFLEGASNITIKDNHILQCKTNAIYFSVSSKPEKVIIWKNSLKDNVGFAIAIERGSEEIKLLDNILSNNAAAFPMQIYMAIPPKKMW